MRKVRVDGKDGIFHQWGLSVTEDDYCHLHPYTVAVVELNNGSVVTVPPAQVTFLEPAIY
jgi:hypothetical protein